MVGRLPLRGLAVPAAVASLAGIGLDLVGNSLDHTWPGAPHWLWAAITIVGLVMTFAFPMWLAWKYVFPLIGFRRPRKADEEAIEPDRQRQDNERRALIANAREFVVKACEKKGAETDFRKKLEAYVPYYELRPHLSDDFRAKWNATRVIHVFADDPNLPDIAVFFLNELDRLEKEWGLR
jgi:hypothetical protein